MSRYDSRSTEEQEKFFGRVNFLTDWYTGYKLTQIACAGGLLLAMLLFRLNIPIVSFFTSFAVMWFMSYCYMGAIVFIGGILFAFTKAAVTNNTDISLFEKAIVKLPTISFAATIVLLIITWSSADPHQVATDALMMPIYIILAVAKVFFG